MLIFTDLDSTLLDPETYSWEAAATAVAELKRRGIPLILNSSKTIDELVPLAQELDTRAPLVAENGSVIAMPDAKGASYPENRHMVLGRRYEDIIFILSQLREKNGFDFIGFRDMSPEQVADQTGLSLTEAARARRRKGTEPIRWLDDDTCLEEFRIELDKRGLTLTRGGRFFHVASSQNKGDALRWLRNYYAEPSPELDWFTVALGDSANDFPMLVAADQAVYVGPRPVPAELTSRIDQLMVTTRPGPEGWNSAVLSLLDTHQKEVIA